MASSTTPPRRALRTSAAAQYLGVSPSLLRKKRLQGPSDPQDPGPAYIQLSPSLIVYTIADLDAWLDAHPRRQSSLSDICERERCNFHLLDPAAQAETIRRMAAACMNDQSIVMATGLSAEIVRRVLSGRATRRQDTP
jgi:hypothetical protein